MKCFLCKNSKDFTPLFPEFCNTENYLCDNCGLVFIGKRKEAEVKSYYKLGGYFSKSPNLGLRKQIVSRNLLIALAGGRIEKMEKELKLDFRNKSVLDVGCGYGEILYVLKRGYNCDVLGIEPSKETAEIGRDLFNIKIASVTLEEYKAKKKFDIVLCSHTLEHTNEPSKFLNIIKRIISKKGVLYVEVPNIFNPTGGYPLKKFFYDEHLQNFNIFSLGKTLNASGFIVTDYRASSNLYVVCDSLKRPKKIKEIKSKEVIAFLRQYRESYTLVKFLKIYYFKAIYLCKALYYKFLVK